MCYSARIVADYEKLVRACGPIMGLDEFVALFERWEAKDVAFRMPKALLDALADESRLRPYIDRHRTRDTMRQERGPIRAAQATRRRRTSAVREGDESRIGKRPHCGQQD